MALALLLSASAASGAQGRDRIVVACDEAYPPYVFRDSGGRLRGIVPDQWAEWSKATGIRVDLQGYPWAQAIAAFESGRAEVLDTVFETEERRKKYDFTPPYAEIEVPVFIHKTISGIRSAADLKGFRVAVKDGDASIGALAALGVDSVDRYKDYEDIVAAAARLDARIFCVDKPPALYYLYKLGADKDYRIAFSLPGGAFRRAVPKGSAELLALVERGFQAVPKRAYDRIDRDWLGAPIASLLDARVLRIVFGSLVALLALASATAWVLRRRIAAATAELRVKVGLLEESEARNRAVIAALPDPIFVLDREGRYLSCSASDASRLFLPAEQLVGKRIDEVGFPPGLADAFKAEIREALEARSIRVFDYDLPLAPGPTSFEGRVVPLSGDRVLLVARDVTERRRQEERLERSLEEKSVLLKEIHHRVKNNMQVISSLIALQAGSFRDQDDKRLLAETQQRIKSLAGLHELLYDSPDLASIGVVEYLESLAREISLGYGRGRIEVEGPRGVRLSMDDAVPLGLVANELLTNAVKYAYPGGLDGRIRASLGAEGERIRLSVEDWGAGLAPGVDPSSDGSMGFLLVRSLASQLGGALSFGGPPGFRAELSFRREAAAGGPARPGGSRD